MVSRELVAASASPIVLSILAKGESYGYAILSEVRKLSGGELEWTDGMLYPVLHRLEAQGLVQSRWGLAENGRKRKYYKITRKGAAALRVSQSQWKMVHSALTQLWEEDQPCSP